jgi:hypothetical protein
MLVDLDLKSNSITPPGFIAAAQIDEVLPSEHILQKAACFFQGDSKPITSEFYQTQMTEMATIVKQKLEQDLKDFKAENNIEDDDSKEGQDVVRPCFPRLYGSGCVINSFTFQA